MLVMFSPISVADELFSQLPWNKHNKLTYKQITVKY